MAYYSIVHREPTPYVAIRQAAPVSRLAEVMVPLGPELFGWLAQRGVTAAGPLFWRYLVIDMQHELVIEVGVPLALEAIGDDRVTAGILPGGNFATVIHRGHPDSLEAATAELLEWGDRHGTWDKVDADGAERWVCRLESYLSDPVDEPDMNEWRTELAFRLA